MPLRLSSLLNGLRDTPSGATETGVAEAKRSLTIDDVLQKTRHAGFGFITGFLALAAVPFVGLSLPFGLAIAFGGFQMIIGRQQPWLPRWVGKHRVTEKTLAWLEKGLRSATRWLERLVRPRLLLFTRGALWRLVGAGIAFQGLGLALPIPLPGSNWMFLAPIVVYTIGLLEDDGALILVGHAATLAYLVLGIWFGSFIVDQVAALFA